jgi:hypothetical protein
MEGRGVAERQRGEGVARSMDICTMIDELPVLGAAPESPAGRCDEYFALPSARRDGDLRLRIPVQIRGKGLLDSPSDRRRIGVGGGLRNVNRQVIRGLAERLEFLNELRIGGVGGDSKQQEQSSYRGNLRQHLTISVNGDQNTTNQAYVATRQDRVSCQALITPIIGP